MKEFTSSDVVEGTLPRISLGNHHEDLIDAPLWWHNQGLQQTASGYGRKLTTHWKIRFNGRDYRVYATCISNAASHWFTANGRKIWID